MWLLATKIREWLDQRIASEIALKAQREAETRATQAKILTDKLETLHKLTPAVAFAYGLSAAFVYFFLASNFFPSGVTFGDTLLFVFIAMGFTLVALLFVAAGLTAVMLPAAYVYKDPDKNKLDAGKHKRDIGLFVLSAVMPFLIGWLASNFPAAPWIALFGSLLIASVIYRKAKLIYNSLDDTEVLLFILAQTVIWTVLSMLFLLPLETTLPFWTTAIGAGMAVALALWLQDSSPPTASHAGGKFLTTVVLCAIAMLLPLALDVAKTRGGLVSMVFTHLGFRSEAAAVRLSGDSLNNVKAAAAAAGINLAICHEDDTHATVFPVDVLWHGMGTRSLIALSHGQSALIRTHADDIEVTSEELKLQRRKSMICQDLRTRPLFKTGDDSYVGKDPIPLLKAEGARFLAQMRATDCKTTDDRSCGWDLHSVIVAGYADERPIKDDGNEALACKRATKVLSDLERQTTDTRVTGLISDKVHQIPVSLGTRSSANNCKETKDKHAASDCNAPYRRAQVRLLYAPYVGDPPTVQQTKEQGCASLTSFDEIYITPPQTLATAQPQGAKPKK